jgi:hypothetical protein
MCEMNPSSPSAFGFNRDAIMQKLCSRSYLSVAKAKAQRMPGDRNPSGYGSRIFQRLIIVGSIALVSSERGAKSFVFVSTSKKRGENLTPSLTHVVIICVFFWFV